MALHRNHLWGGYRLTEAEKRIEQLKAGGVFDRLRREPTNSVLPVPPKPSVLPGALPKITESQPSEAPVAPNTFGRPAIAPKPPAKTAPLKLRPSEPGLPQPAPERKFPIIEVPVQPNNANLQSLKERLMQPESNPELDSPAPLESDEATDGVTDQTTEEAIAAPDQEMPSIEIP